MQAILKRSHNEFCTLIEEIRVSRCLLAPDLAKMESELCAIFQNYQQRLDDLRELILEYDAKKKTIRNKLKQLVREETIKGAYNKI